MKEVGIGLFFLGFFIYMGLEAMPADVTVYIDSECREHEYRVPNE